MFSAFVPITAPVETLVQVAQSFSPRVEIAGRLVITDLAGVERLFGGPRDIAEHMRRALVSAGAVRLGLAPTQTTAALLALGRPGLTVAGDQAEAGALLAALPVSVLGQWEGAGDAVADARPAAAGETALEGAASRWAHPRDTHQGPQTRRQIRGRVRVAGNRQAATAEKARIGQALDVLRRWGIRTLGQLAALSADDLAARLGSLGPRWQHAARGEDLLPLVPLAHDEPFEASLALEWPIEGLEPLSFVLGRVLEPLAVRLERADRGAAVLTTDLHLTTREVYSRTLQLPAPMREPKTLRTLVLLDLESHPPNAAIDRVVVRIEPTPGRVVQWSLIERAQPSPEQVSTLLARLGALMGESHVGSPALVDSWRPGAFTMRAFDIPQVPQRLGAAGAPTRGLSAWGGASGWRPDNTKHDTAGSVAADSETTRSTSREPRAASPCAVAFRRFRLPVPARVTVKDGRPVRLQPDRRGVSGGAIVDAAGPWRTSGHWWDQPPTPTGGAAAAAHPTAWDRDEWDVLLADGVACRVFLERDAGQWFVEGTFD